MSSLPRDAADRVLRLAIEMQSRRGEHLTEAEIHDVARQVGIEPEHVRMALEVEHAREAALQRAAVESAVSEASPFSPEDIVRLVVAILMGLIFTAAGFAMIPDIVQAYREADTTSEYFGLVMFALLWVLVMSPLGFVVFGGIWAFRHRRRR
jgi:hypothetical protein